MESLSRAKAGANDQQAQGGCKYRRTKHGLRPSLIKAAIRDKTRIQRNRCCGSRSRLLPLILQQIDQLLLGMLLLLFRLQLGEGSGPIVFLHLRRSRSWASCHMRVLSAICANACSTERAPSAGVKLYFSSGISSAIWIVFWRTVRKLAASCLAP